MRPDNNRLEAVAKSPTGVPVNSHPDAIRASIRHLIVSIKPLADGFDELTDDAPLFSDAAGSPSPVSLDSLDTLDLAMSIGDEFDLNNDEFERLIESDEGLDKLRTVNDITELVLSLTQVRSGGAEADINSRGREVTA